MRRHVPDDTLRPARAPLTILLVLHGCADSILCQTCRPFQFDENLAGITPNFPPQDRGSYHVQRLEAAIHPSRSHADTVPSLLLRDPLPPISVEALQLS